MNKIDTLPEIEWLDLKEYKDNTPSLLLTSQSVQSIAQEYLVGVNYRDTYLISAGTANHIASFTKPSIQIKKIYAVGGGRVIDIARLLAFNWHLDLIAIPTIISSDAFLVNCTGVRENGCVKYVPSTPAKKIFLDWDLLQKVPLKYHLTGSGDVLSIFTGLHDWKYANKKKHAQDDEKYDKSVDIMAQSILNGLISMQPEIAKGSREGINAIITALSMEVQLCYFYGNSRPEEGGEHFFAYCIENKLPHFLHGEMVALGILLTGYIQGQDIDPIQKFMDEIGLSYKPQGVTQKIIKETLQELPEYVIKHSLRYSVYNEYTFSEKNAHLEYFFKKINLQE